MVTVPRALARRSRPARIVTVCVAGHPPSQQRFNTNRIELLSKVVHEIRRRPELDPIDAVLFPAGYFRLSQWFGALSDPERFDAISSELLAEACEHAAGRLFKRSPGCLVVVGIDTNRPASTWHGCGWRGDQLVAAFDADGAVGIARKIFPVSQDTDGWGRAPYLLFTDDALSGARFVELPNGDTALLSACYDAFVHTELVLGPTKKRLAMRYIGSTTGEGWDELSRREADRMLEAFEIRLAEYQPRVHLAAIHGFKRPGGELLWQRHGIATASAALEGALTVGAAHFSESLPASADSAPLAAFGVFRSHLHAGAHREACAHYPIASFETHLKWAPSTRALVRLFEAR